MSGLSTTSSSAATSSSSSTASSLRQSSEECPSFDWRELSRRMSANDPILDDIVDDRAKLLLMAVMKAPFDLFQWILSLCPECTRIPTSSGWLPLHVAVAHQVSTRRLQKLLEVYPESIHALTRQGESVWSLAQKAPLDATSLELLRQSATSVAMLTVVSKQIELPVLWGFTLANDARRMAVQWWGNDGWSSQIQQKSEWGGGPSTLANDVHDRMGQL
ncbi:hypothetical protein AaE_009275 [Aphanomyces astaci]|uniref:Ankyrin repeat domain-containing protein n=1 Tax=Aphanomyces astaci TaxID=112090 RepID=A0A6A5A583_APHAT|nr:hypothetical protein AaE_009275 [Aphanomyces astaci]